MSLITLLRIVLALTLFFLHNPSIPHFFSPPVNSYSNLLRSNMASSCGRSISTQPSPLCCPVLFSHSPTPCCDHYCRFTDNFTTYSNKKYSFHCLLQPGRCSNYENRVCRFALLVRMKHALLLHSLSSKLCQGLLNKVWFMSVGVI